MAQALTVVTASSKARAAVISWILVLLAWAPGLGAQILVPEDYDTIQEALDAAEDGDEISVDAGVYEENIEFVANDVHLFSREALGATIDGGGEGVVTMVGTGGRVTGFVIQNGSDGIEAVDTAVTIVGNRFVDNDCGVRISSAPASVIAGNVVAGNVCGIDVSLSEDVEVINNTVSDHQQAIRFGESTGIIRNNLVTDSEAGIHAFNPPGGIAFLDCLVLLAGLPVTSDALTVTDNLVFDNEIDYEVRIEVGDIIGDLVLCDQSGELMVGDNLAEDPMLDTLGIYQLLPGSPAIDAGRNSALPSDIVLDVDGNERLFDDVDTDDSGLGSAPLVDIGAFEFQGGTINPSFVRGDANADGEITVADPIYNLTDLFLVGPSICLDAQDVNDDGRVDIADPIFSLDFVFLGGPQPADPYPDCGVDSTDDAVPCNTVFFCD